MVKRFLSVFAFLLACSAALAVTEHADTLKQRTTDASGYQEMKRIVRGFDWIDTTYIEPQHHNFTVMLQATNTYDRYSLSADRDIQSMTFAPDMNFKLGPYFGWRWIFGGYTFELTNLNFNSVKQEWALSLYSSQIGVDLFYRRTGNDYKIRDANLGKGIDASPLEGASFNGLKAGITGFNVYYIFNHGRFSYPAAFSQSTIQKISCGSWMAGIGYTHNTLSFDHEALQDLIDRKMMAATVPLDSGLMFQSAKYNDFNISGGYGYNWVFARNWLLAGSLQAALAYKQSKGDMATDERHDLDFFFKKVNINGIGRFGIVYNKLRWFVGASVIVHTNNFHKPRFSTNNTFGSMNVYVGYNFGLKKKYRKRKE